MASWCVQISYPKNQHSTTSYHISTNNNHNGDEIVKKKKDEMVDTDKNITR